MMTRKFTEDHEWISIDGNIATVGITSFAQSKLGDVVYVELPQIGRAVKKGEALAIVESVKAASDVFSPLSGEVVAVNESIVTDPAQVNADPENTAWMFKVRIANRGELDSLMDEAAYRQHIV